jgi:hypothetical protein
MKRTWILITLVAGLGLVGCATSDNGDQPKAASEKKAEKAPEKPPEKGMTKEQILQMYGKTDNVTVGSDGETWTYHLNMGEAFIPFNFGYRPKLRIINFDKEGKVASWSYSK